jgi:hypothetical protein
MGQSPSQASSNITECWPPLLNDCWSVPERIQIERISNLCENFPQLAFHGGQSDESDPWFIVYDREHDQVVADIARIERRYVMVCASRPKPLTVARCRPP